MDREQRDLGDECECDDCTEPIKIEDIEEQLNDAPGG